MTRDVQEHDIFHKIEKNSLRTEINSVDNVGLKKLIVTIDSAAAKSVMNETHAPSVPTRTRKGSFTDVKYVNVNGITMPN